jgi:hypothetical protein
VNPTTKIQNISLGNIINSLHCVIFSIPIDCPCAQESTESHLEPVSRRPELDFMHCIIHFNGIKS